jgi:hypothetical protein
MDLVTFRSSLFTDEQAQRLVDEHNYYRKFQNASDMEMMVWDQDLGTLMLLTYCKKNLRLADAAQEWVESCECSALCEHGFSPDTSGRYGNKPWFHLGFNDEQRFGQNLYFSFLDNETATSDPIRQWHGEIRAYNYGSRTFLGRIYSNNRQFID